MSDHSLADELRRAKAQLSPPPGESPVTTKYARLAVVLLACLRYSGVDDSEIEARLSQLDLSFVAAQAEVLRSSAAKDAGEAAGLLEVLLQQPDLEVEQVMAVASVGVSGTY
jgi:hypothetical protein